MEQVIELRASLEELRTIKNIMIAVYILGAVEVAFCLKSLIRYTLRQN